MIGISSQSSPTRGPAAGFTLVEMLIVVVIMGILGAVVVPQFSNVSETAKDSMLAENLRVMRGQVVIFRAEHLGVAPGYPNYNPDAAPDADTFVAHMTQTSTAVGQMPAPAGAERVYGPYMATMPDNPINGRNTVRVIANDVPFPDAGTGANGWIYQPSTLTFKPDLNGTDQDGEPFFDY